MRISPVMYDYFESLSDFERNNPHMDKRVTIMRHLSVYDEAVHFALQGTAYDPTLTDIPLEQFYAHVKLLIGDEE